MTAKIKPASDGVGEGGFDKQRVAGGKKRREEVKKNKQKEAIHGSS